jgi:hypothetical protein
MPVRPSQFDTVPPFDLLREVELGRLGFDGRLARSLLARRAETLEALARLTGRTRDGRRIDIAEQIYDLYLQLGALEGVPFLLRHAVRKGDTDSEDLAGVLMRLGPDVLDPALAEYGMAEEEEAKSDLLFLLASLGMTHPRLGELIRQRIREDPLDGALLAGLYGDAALRPALEAALEGLPPGAEDERIALRDTIEDLGGPRECPDDEPVNIFNHYPEVAPPVFDVLSDEELAGFLASEEEDHRAGAALSLVDADFGETLAAALLKTAAGDSSPRVRAACYRALGECNDEGARALLYEALRAPAATLNERAGVVLGLAHFSQDPEVHRAILKLYEAPESRAAALEAMGRSRDDRYADYFLPNIHDSDPEIRRQAVQGIGLFGIGAAAEELVPLMRDEEIREAAIFAYALAAPVKGRFSSKDGHRLYDQIEDLAGGLSGPEQDDVSTALDIRLEGAGRKREFTEFSSLDDEEDDRPAPPPPPRPAKVGRNEPCPCGSGKKYKKCCGAG